MATIPQRELRNNVSAVLRRAEAGERITVTVDGRPVAELGPVAGAPRPGSRASLIDIIAHAPADESWSDDLARMRTEDLAAARDPWTS